MTLDDIVAVPPAERYLRDWHHRHPDASRVFVGARDQTGRSSYQRLAELSLHSTAVLDLACGTGSLLSFVRDVAPAAQLVGVDLSEPELRHAARRAETSHLTVARAQALPLPTGAFDLVLCHMALMLMDRPEDVLLEIRRVLRPGGRFSAITNRPSAPNPMAKAILGPLRPAFERASASLHPPPLGDARTYQAETLRELLGAHFEDVSVEEFDLVEHVPRRELWPFLVDSVYGVDAINEDEGQGILDRLSLPDPVPWTVPMVQILGQRVGRNRTAS